MEQTQSMIIFEHPLNEKMRTCLRIEFLINQLEQNRTFNKDNPLSFFYVLSELLEITERNDLRNDLAKDLDELKQKLNTWVQSPNVETTLINEILEKVNCTLQQLNTSPKIGKNLKNDRLITTIRKRLTIPGGCCNFDLPFFHLWLHQSQQTRDEQINEWLDDFATLKQASFIYLKLIRQSNHFEPLTCINNYFRQHNEPVKLLRVRIPISTNVYPQISGNTDRYTIRFISFDASKINDNKTEFELACCL